MKTITATIRMCKLQDVKEALAHFHIHQMTIFKVTVSEKRDDESVESNGITSEFNLVDRVRIEIAAADDIAPRIVQAIRDTANTGNAGDGVISMYEIVQSINIRTGEEA